MRSSARLRTLAGILAIIALVAWWMARRTSEAGARARAADAVAAGSATREAPRTARPARSPSLMMPGAPFAAGAIAVTGHVVDVRDRAPIGGVEVVFRSAAGETSTTAAADGSYAIQLEAGMYHAFVRDDAVLSVGIADLERIPGGPRSDAVGAPDEALMTMVLATRDTDNVDLGVVRGGVVLGRVVDRSGRAVAGAVIRARGIDERPVLGTDVAESDRDGSFELRLPVGQFQLDADHPQLAGVLGLAGAPGQPPEPAQLSISAGDKQRVTLMLTAGCAITGRVVRADGSPAGDGAIERRWSEAEHAFTPVATLRTDGTFRWTTTDTATIDLRAWPWMAPPSPSQRFACRDGARFDNVVMKLYDEPPVLSGIMVDASGAPVANGYIDIQPLEPNGTFGQQERTDASGRWALYHVPAGAYHVDAQVEGLGVASQELTAPASDVRLVLGGIGRLELDIQGVPAGRTAIAVELSGCLDGDGRMIQLGHRQRMVRVEDGHATLDGVPACDLMFSLQWQERVYAARATTLAGGTQRQTIPLDEEHQLPSEGELEGEGEIGVEVDPETTDVD